AAEAKHREIADLRQRVTESDRNVLDVMLTVGDLFRSAAGRLSSPNVPAAGPPPPAAPPEEPPTPKKPVDTAQTSTGSSAAPAQSAERPAAGAAYLDSDVPSFAQPRKATALWSIPLV